MWGFAVPMYVTMSMLLQDAAVWYVSSQRNTDTVGFSSTSKIFCLRQLQIIDFIFLKGQSAQCVFYTSFVSPCVSDTRFVYLLACDCLFDSEEFPWDITMMLARINDTVNSYAAHLSLHLLR